VNYFFKLINSYPKATVIGMFLYGVSSLLKLILLDKVEFTVSVLAVVGSVLMILCMKIWLIAYFRDGVFTAKSIDFPWPLLLSTLLVLTFSIVLLAPLLGSHLYL